jgi:3-deoxy-D-manno-octulosonic-acid transferase
MYLVYSLLLGLGFIIMLPKFLLDAWRHGKYVSGLSERLGSLAKNTDQRPAIWLHCVSVGEVQAARPLFQALRQEFPAHAILVSTVTVTGQELAREVFRNDAARVFYFPVDWRWSVRRALTAINPSLVLLMETELWPNFLFECRRRNIPTAIVNGRLSEKSFGRYQMIKSFIARVLSGLTLAVMQTEVDAGRIQKLGLAAERLAISGNMKFDAGVVSESEELVEEFSNRFGFRDSRPVILAASTHDSEERIVLDSFRKLRASGLADTRLVIAPRHRERFNTVASLLNDSQLSKFSWTRRTDAPSDNDRKVDIVLLDSIGELRALFPLASVVFVGGSIARVGGHNILEPAEAGACIVTGPHTKNFAEIVRTFSARGALIQLDEQHNGAMASELTAIFEGLLNDEARRNELGARGRALVEENRGATARTITLLKELAWLRHRVDR